MRGALRGGGVGATQLFHPVIKHRKLSGEVRSWRRNKLVSLFHMPFEKIGMINAVEKTAETQSPTLTNPS